MKFDRVEKWRVLDGPFATKTRDDFGFFFIPIRTHKAPLKILSAPSDEDWQHVSVSLPDRCPTWEELCLVKDLFWTDEDCVVQFYPPKSDYISNCRFCLHLWRWTKGDFPRPPKELVGIKSLGEMA